MKDWILPTPHEMGVFNDIVCKDGDRLIVGYSEERARKRAYMTAMKALSTSENGMQSAH